MALIYKLKFLLILTGFFFLSGFYAKAQNENPDFLKEISDSILREGIEIYECASASFISSEFLIEKLSVENITGYITYKDEKGNSIKTIFFGGNNKKPIVWYTFSYKNSFNPGDKNIDGEPRQLSDYEVSLFKMKKKILKLAKKRKSVFVNYDEIVLNPVFIQKGNFTWVYLISSTHHDSFIPLGNDYLLVFDAKEKIISKEKIHQNLIEIPMVANDTLNADEALASYHIHSELSSPFISSTDICTFLLNREKWKSHVVVSAEYVSFFFPEQKILEIITKEEYEKIKGSE